MSISRKICYYAEVNARNFPAYENMAAANAANLYAFGYYPADQPLTLAAVTWADEYKNALNRPQAREKILEFLNPSPTGRCRRQRRTLQYIIIDKTIYICANKVTAGVLLSYLLGEVPIPPDILPIRDLTNTVHRSTVHRRTTVR